MKTCANCGSANLDDAQFCQTCGRSLAAAAEAASAARPLTSRKAIGSLASGIFVLLVPAAIAVSVQGVMSGVLVVGIVALFAVAAITAVVLGHLSRPQIRRSGGKLKGYGIALAGLILGYIGIGLIAVLLTSVLVNPPHTRQAANEASAVGSLRTLNVAAVTYSTQCAGFPATLATMGPPVNGCTTADLIDSVLVTGSKRGYTFTYAAGDADGDGRMDTYTVTAIPSNVGTTGQRHFFVDQTGVIRVEMNQPASADSPPIS